MPASRGWADWASRLGCGKSWFSCLHHIIDRPGAAVVPGMLIAGADPRAAGRGSTAWFALFLQAWLPQLGFQDVPAGRALALMPTLTKILFFHAFFHGWHLLTAASALNRVVLPPR